MKQILQDLKNGQSYVEEVPMPHCQAGQVLIRTHCSLISSGTERMLLEFGKGGWIAKAKSQPEKVRQVLNKIKTDGFWSTFVAVKDKLDQPIPMGYCNVGEVIEVGDQVSEFQVGDRVVSNGHHAEFVLVPKQLCAKIPNNVSDEEAVFTIIAAIALQSIRLLQASLGENIVVMGLGLVGLLTVQLLRAQGCRVLASDFQLERLKLAEAAGAETINLSNGEDILTRAKIFSQGQGVDGVIIATATQDNSPVEQAAEICRKRGRIVLVGTSGLHLSRDAFYEKELSFQVSCSYGPGRYDEAYEQKGQDYPIGFVRWTEQRNFQAVLNLLAEKKLSLVEFISHRFALNEAEKAYDLLTKKTPSLGILLNYPLDALAEKTVHLNHEVTNPQAQQARVAVIGAGNHVIRQILPALKNTSAIIEYIVSAGGVSAKRAAKKAKAKKATTDIDAVFNDPSVNTIIIATRHDSHADLVCRALQTGKHVFVEKPLAISIEQLNKIETVYQSLETKPILMLGFNRRFAPQIVKMKQLLNPLKTAKAFIITVNAGPIPADHWVHDIQQGGGRVVGEACHFVDLLRFLAGSPIVSYQLSAMQTVPMLYDNVTINLSFQDGSIGSIHYLANGSKEFSKERIEVFANGGILQLDNFRLLQAYSWPRFKKMKLSKQDKGHRACLASFIQAVTVTQNNPIPIEEVLEVNRLLLQPNQSSFLRESND